MNTSPQPAFRLRTTVLVVVAMLFLGAIIIALDRKQVGQLAGRADWRFILAALFFTAVSYVCASLSVVYILRVFGVRLRGSYLFRVGLLSFVLQNLIALPAGLSLRLLLLGAHGVNNSRTVGSSLLLAYFKNLAYFALIPPSLVFVVLTRPLPAGATATIALVCALTIAGIIVAGVIVLNRRARVFVLRIVRRLWHFVTRRDIRPNLVLFEQAVAEGITQLRPKGGLRLPLTLLIMGDIAATIAALWFCFVALGIPIHLGVLITGFYFGITLTVISFVPGDLGVQEASMAGVFALFGVPFSQGVLAAILFRVLYYFVPFAVSLGFYWHTLREAAKGPGGYAGAHAIMKSQASENMLPDFGFPQDYPARSRAMLEKALRDVPAYQLWQVCDPGPAFPVDERYAALPALTKADIRRSFPQGFVPAGTDVQRGLDEGEISFIETSGTTENRVPNIWHQDWWDASERASWQLNSVAARLATGTHAEAILANAINVGPASDEADLPLAARRLARFVFLNEKTNPASWQAPLMERMLAELVAFKPAVLEANPSLLAKLCRYAAGKAGVFQPGLIVFTYERPTLLHEAQIRRVFPEVPFTSSYGATEVGYVFMQCEAGRLHQNSEYCRVDFQPLKPEHGGPLLGRILVTTFQNPWFYILRFNVGDLVRLEAGGRCPCGRATGFILAGVEGRAADATLTTGGRLVTVGELDRAVSALRGVDEYRLEQTAPASYDFYLVAAREKQAGLRRQATFLLRDLYGAQANVSVTFEKALTPEVSGKYRIARSLLPLRIEDYLLPTKECEVR